MAIDVEPAGRRTAKLAEVISFIKAHWQGHQLSFSGDFVQVNGYARQPRPVQRHILRS